MPAYHKLSAMRVSSLKEPGRYSDGLGLWLQVSKWKTKSWIFQYTVHGRVRQFGLGPTHTVTLAEARQQATECRKQVRDGIDLIERRKDERTQKRVEEAKSLTFTEAAEQFIASHQDGWRNSIGANGVRRWSDTPIRSSAICRSRRSTLA
jgi:Arm DNA-binding domain